MDFSIDSFRTRVNKMSDNPYAGEVFGDHLLNPTLGRADSRMNLKDAAVLIPLLDREGEAMVMLTHRTENLPTHAGQVAFPGGKVDKHDKDEIATAIRECEEEIGINGKYLVPFAVLPPYLAFSGFRIFPVIATIKPGFEIKLNEDEVSSVFEVPLSFLMTAENHQTKSHDFKGKERYYYVMPYKEHYIWGVTAGIIRSLYEKVIVE